MSTWDIEIFSREANTDFLDELATLDDEDIVEAVEAFGRRTGKWALCSNNCGDLGGGPIFCQ